MKKGIALLLLGLALTGTGMVEAETMLPWSTVSDLEGQITRAYPLAGCSDARPIAIYIVKHGSDTYHLIVSTDDRWVVIGPTDTQGETPIWYGPVGEGDRLVIERVLVGTPETDVCPFLMRRNA